MTVTAATVFTREAQEQHEGNCMYEDTGNAAVARLLQHAVSVLLLQRTFQCQVQGHQLRAGTQREMEKNHFFCAKIKV